MEYFFSSELPDYVQDTILNSDSKQFGWHTDMEDAALVVTSCAAQVKSGVLVVAYHKHCVFFLHDYLPGVVMLDSLRGKEASIFDYLDGAKELLRYLEDHTKIHKIVTKTPFKDLIKLQKRVGFVVEGTHKEEYLTTDGSYLDMYSFGYILRRDTCPS